MKRVLAVALALCAPLPVTAQNAITQEGTVLQNAPMMFRGNNRARQGAPVGGAPSGQIITTGDATVGGRCDYSDPTDAPSGYYKLCIDAKSGKIIWGGTKSPQTTPVLEVNGVVYPFVGQGAGNTVGGAPTVINNLTCWNDTLGTFIKDCGGPLATTGGGLVASGRNTAAYTTTSSFSKIENTQGTVLDGDLFGLPQYNTFEVRADIPAGTTVQNAAAVGAYVMNRTPSLGESGNSVAFMGISNAVVNNAAVWGINTVQNTTDPNGTGKVLQGYEGDFNMASPNDRLIGIGLYGTSTATLTSNVRDGVVVGSLSVQSPGLTTWLRGFACNPAAIIPNGVCLDIQPEATTGAFVKGPAINFWYTDATEVKHFISMHAGTDRNLIFASDTGTTNGGVDFYPRVHFRDRADWVFDIAGVEHRYTSTVDLPTHKLVITGTPTDATVQFNSTVALAGPVTLVSPPTACTGLPVGTLYMDSTTRALYVC